VPELPDISIYVEHLERRLERETLDALDIRGPNLLRSVEPPVEDAVGRRVEGVRRMGKRIVLGFEGDLFLVLHLMIAGRLHWRDRGAAREVARRGAASGGKNRLASFEFAPGTLTLTEAGTKKRASLTAVRGEAALAALDPGGVEPLDASLDAFGGALTRERHTLKRALTDPRAFSGIGNAYSDEILHRARLSPLRQTHQLEPAEIQRLRDATRAVLVEWTDRLRAQAGEGFPENVTAFREGMAVHGRFGEPCPDCGAPVQRIVYAENETNYCARCQTGGRLLADRALSRLLRKDWPRRFEELDERG
jgi:formamidopyrimidine-DNA glycosylase